MGRGSQNLLYAPISSSLLEKEKGELQWTAEINHLNSQNLERFSWLDQVINLADISADDQSLLKPLTNLLVHRLERYISYGYLKNVDQDLTAQAKRLFTLVYNNRSLIEDQRAEKQLFNSLLGHNIKFAKNHYKGRPIKNNLKLIFAKLDIEQGKIYIKPRNNRSKYKHYLQEYTLERFCDSKSWSRQNYTERNEADNGGTSNNISLCPKCAKKMKNKNSSARIKYKKQSFSIFQNSFNNAVSEELLNDNNSKTNDYFEFQDEFINQFLIKKINQAAEKQLNWDNGLQQSLKKLLEKSPQRKLTEPELSAVPQVRLSFD